MSWQDLTGEDDVGHQRRLDLGAPRPSKDACALTVTKKQQSPRA